MAVMWRVARRAYQLPDEDILAPTSTSWGAPTPVIGGHPAASASGARPTKKVKLSSHVDQMDDNEVDIISRNDLDECYRNFREVTGADPLADCDPPMEQVTAMRSKIVDRMEAPFADFSVMVPHGKELQKTMKTRNWLLQEDGTFKGVDVPGPPNYAAWVKCWKVYRTVLLMLKHLPIPPEAPKPVVNIACLEEYADKIYELIQEFPECYHLVWEAENRCRRDEFERIRRLLTRARMEGTLPMNVPFDPTQPWIGVFTFAARDGEYWAKNVIRPAQTFLARGGSGKKMTREAAEATLIDTEMIRNAGGRANPPGQGTSRNARKRRSEKARDDATKQWNTAADKGQKPWEASSSWASKGSKASGKNVHPRKFGQLFITTREGDEVCFKFSKGAAGACAEPCPDGRVHCCQYCLGPHPNAQCSKAKAPKGGKGPSK